MEEVRGPAGFVFRLSARNMFKKIQERHPPHMSVQLECENEDGKSLGMRNIATYPTKQAANTSPVPPTPAITHALFFTRYRIPTCPAYREVMNPDPACVAEDSRSCRHGDVRTQRRHRCRRSFRKSAWSDVVGDLVVEIGRAHV